jgi:hypothetical protein
MVRRRRPQADERPRVEPVAGQEPLGERRGIATAVAVGADVLHPVVRDVDGRRDRQADELRVGQRMRCERALKRVGVAERQRAHQRQQLVGAEDVRVERHRIVPVALGGAPAPDGAILELRHRDLAVEWIAVRHAGIHAERHAHDLRVRVEQRDLGAVDRERRLEELVVHQERDARAAPEQRQRDVLERAEGRGLIDERHLGVQVANPLVAARRALVGRDMHHGEVDRAPLREVQVDALQEQVELGGAILGEDDEVHHVVYVGAARRTL